MLRTFTSRIAVTSFLTVAGFLSLNAKAQAPITTSLVFSVTGATYTSTVSGVDTYTVTKSAISVLPVKVTISDANGLTTASLSSKVGSGTVRLGGATTGTLGVTFFDSYYPAGSYTFTATATNAQNVTTTKQIVVTTK